MRGCLARVDRFLERLVDVLPADHDHRIDAVVLEERRARGAGDGVRLVLDLLDRTDLVRRAMQILEVREERGLAYSVGASLHPLSDTGLFYVHASTSLREAAATSHLIGEILHDSVETIVVREVERVRTRAAAGLLMHLETPWGQASYASRQLAVYDRLVEPTEVLDQLARFTIEDVCAAGAKMLAGPRSTATIGVPAVRAA